ncbi:MAG TPA: DUF2723 domain-containing protein [Fibrobacteraceae bacterium]|nr:DUF2723 domain-containing protein [Fibrobacteraceae bacterium]
MTAFLKTSIRLPEFWARLALLLLTTIVYGLTLSPSASFWDCGEFIAAAHVLGIPHPPGTPLFVILGRVWDLLLFWAGPVAFRINLLSAAASVLGALFSFQIALEVLRRWDLKPSLRAALAFLAGALVAFGDTWWFNAVEAEVYGVSMAMLLGSVWVLLRWDRAEHSERAPWLVLFVYLSFLGIGVHTNSMLVFPFGWIFVGARSDRLKPKRWLWAFCGFVVLLLALLLAQPAWYSSTLLRIFALLGMGGLLAWSVRQRELLDLPFWILGAFLFTVVFLTQTFLEGLALAAVLLGGLWVYGRLVRRRPSSVPSLQHLSVGLALALILVAGLGFSVQLVIPIRSSTNPVLDENNPETWPLLLDFLERKQYGSMGMFERALWRRADPVHQLGFSERIGYLGYHLNQFMPAPLGAQTPTSLTQGLLSSGWMGVSHLVHRVFWEFILVVVLWAGFLLRKDPRAVFLWCLFVCMALGLIFYVNFADGSRPDSRDASAWQKSMALLQKELVNQGLPNLPPRDEMRRSIEEWKVTRKVTPSMEALLQWEKAAVRAGTHVPMPPRNVHREVRERDYFFTPVFALFGILCALALGLWAQRTSYAWVRQGVFVVACGCWLLPLVTHFQTHDRSGDWVPREFAANLLQSVPPHGILLTFGDNDTFPLWYLQMVERVRTDVLVVNTSLAQMRWYEEQMLAQRPDLHLTHTLNELWSQGRRRQGSPRISVHGEEGYYAGDSLWAPTPGRQFLAELVLENWPRVPVCYMFTANPRDLPGGGRLGNQWSPIAGLVRQLGLDPAKADSLLVRRSASEYQMRGFANGLWRWQESTARSAANFRLLFSLAESKAQGTILDTLRQRRALLD